MIPVLYTHEETAFLSNGIGRLSDCISCEVTEERNGIFECEFTYPITGKHYADIKEGMLIYCTHDDTQDPQPFEIYSRSAAIDGVVTFNAHHISYRLSNIVVKPFSLTGSVGQALDALTEHAIGGCPFALRTTKSTTGSFSVKTPDSIRARLGGVEGSILDAFGGGEYSFDKYMVTLYAARGVDNGVSIRYGKNLTDIKADQSIEGRYTGAVPFWADDSGQIVTLPEWYILAPEMPTSTDYWTDESDTIMRSDDGEALEFTHYSIALTPMDLSSEWAEKPTVEQLRAKAESRLAASKAWETDENIDVSFEALWLTPEYEDVAALQRVRLCDTVSVYYPALGVEQKKKVIKTVYNVLLNRYSEIELGLPQSSFADVIRQRTEGLMAGYVRGDAMQEAIENATAMIQGGLGGYVVMKTNAEGQPEEILIMDTPDIETAVHVIRMNQNGIGFSENGYQGPFKTAWTIDGGFVADFITSGILNANLLTAGTIKGETGGNSWNLKTGIFISDSGTRSTQIRGGDILFYKGDIATGRIVPAAWGGDYENAEGVVFVADADAKYLALGHRVRHDGIIGSSADIIINNGLNPDGITQLIQFMSSTYFRNPVTHNAAVTCNQGITCGTRITPSGNGAAAHVLGATDHRWYQVWSTSFNFVTGVYINYNATGDYIYASKTISQASDENLKEIRPYDDRYDALLDALEPFVYKWKARPDGPDHVGLGARKTAKLLQNLGLGDSGFVGINTGEDGEEIYSIDYQELAVMLLHAYHHQKAEVEALKKETAELKAQVQRILEKLEV